MQTAKQTSPRPLKTRKLNRIQDTFRHCDGWLLFFVAILSIYSLIMVYSSTQYLIEGTSTVPEPLSFLYKQFLGIAIGLGVSLVAIFVPYKYFTKPIWLFTANLLITFLILLTRFIGTIGGGAKSWLNIAGFNFQPGELAKIGLIFLLALISMRFTREVLLVKERQIANLDRNVLVALGFMVIDVALILWQPDFGMFVIIAATLALTAILINLIPRNWTIGLILLVAVLGIVALIWIILNADSLATSSSYQARRLGSFLNPFKYAQDAGYQLVNGYIAISRGGFFGRGIGHSLTKQEGLPAGHTDFILAIIGEESGLIGIVAVIACLLAIIFLCFRWAARSQDAFRQTVFTGIGCLLLIQSTLNIGGVSGLLPLTGVTLPFVSYGGTSMVLTMMLVGVLQVMIIEEKRQAERALALSQKEETHGI